MGLPIIFEIVSILLCNAFYVCLEFSMSDFEFPVLSVLFQHVG
jgi:hypothetical protein